MGTPSHLGHMDRVVATMPSQAHAGAAQEAPDIGQWEGQDVPLVRPSSCNVKGGIPSSRRYLPTYLLLAPARPTQCTMRRGQPPPYAVLCEAFFLAPAWWPTPPPGIRMPGGWAHLLLFCPLFRTRGNRHRDQTFWQESTGTPPTPRCRCGVQGPRAGTGGYADQPSRAAARSDAYRTMSSYASLF